jgi:Ca2+-binding EF-hand superfamily protein
MAEHWKKLDTDGDGKVSLAEAKANAPRLAEHFTQIDANGDGFITPEEMKAAHERHGKKK